VSSEEVLGHEEDLRAARKRLGKVRFHLIAEGLAWIGAGLAGWEWTGYFRWSGLVILGTIALLALIPIQVGLRAADRELSDGEQSLPG
jgi:hypothetical protein